MFAKQNHKKKINLERGGMLSHSNTSTLHVDVLCSVRSCPFVRLMTNWNLCQQTHTVFMLISAAQKLRDIFFKFYTSSLLQRKNKTCFLLIFHKTNFRCGQMQFLCSRHLHTCTQICFYFSIGLFLFRSLHQTPLGWSSCFTSLVLKPDTSSHNTSAGTLTVSSAKWCRTLSQGNCTRSSLMQFRSVSGISASQKKYFAQFKYWNMYLC